MELGTGRLAERTTNYILHAVHPQHGLIWTDGKTLFLTPLSLSNSQLHNEKSFKIGEFDIVREVSWSGEKSSKYCYLCVAHREKVAIWKVSGSVPRLGFKQVRKINILTIQQGICWNPKGDLLCLLSKNQCSFYHSHSGKKQSYALPPFESATIKCATWTKDGQKLVTFVGEEILIYRWTDIESNPKEFTEYSFNLSEPVSNIISVIALPGDRIVFATELSLAQQIKKTQDGLIASKTEESQKIEDVNGVTTIKENGSALHNLFNIQSSSQKSKVDSSELILIDLDDRGNIVHRCNIENILQPSLICYEPESQTIVVSSCSHRVIQIYTSQLVKVSEILLDKAERPRGVCSMKCLSSNDAGLLVLAEKKNESDNTFLSSSSPATDIFLNYYSMVGANVNDDGLRHINRIKQYGDIPEKPARKFKRSFDEFQQSSINSSQDSQYSDSSLKSPTNEVITDESGSSSLLIPEKSLVIPNSAQTSLPNGNLIQELNESDKRSQLEYDSVEFNESRPKFRNSKFLNGDVNGNMSVDEIDMLKRKNEKSDEGLKSPNSKATAMTKTKISKQIVKQKTDSELVDAQDEASARLDPVYSLKKYNVLHSSTSSLTSKGDTLEYTDHSKEQVVKQFDNTVCASQTLMSKSMTVTMSSEQGQISEYPFLQKQLSVQTKQIEEIYRRIAHLAQLVEESTCVFPTKYQAPTSPDVVHIALLEDEIVVKKKTFLLDNGRIQLEPVKSVFSLETVDVILDGEAITVGANIDGYIPLRFDPGSTVFICGRPATSR